LEKWLDQAEYIQNTQFHEAIQRSLFFLMHRYNPWNGTEEGESEKSPGQQNGRRNCGKQGECTTSNGEAAKLMKQFYD